MLSRLLAGAQSSMLGPLAVVVLSMTAGALLAVAAAWRRGTVDSVISSGLDILFAFPGILLAVLATAVFGAGLTAAAIALSIAYMPYVARVLRGAALRERSQPYVAALEVQGASATSICLRHLIPNMLPLIVAQATIMFGWAMVDLAAISFLGLGVQPPQANWGVMISENQTGILQGYPLPALVRRGLHRRRGHRVQRAGRAAVRAGSGGRPMNDPLPLLEVDGLTVRLDVRGAQRAVLRDVALTVRQGEALGLVGESGSGKSMTARAIDRLLPRGAEVDGTIRFDGRDVGALSGADLRRYREPGRDDLPGPPRAREPGPPDRRLHDRGAAHQPRREPAPRPAAAPRTCSTQVGIDGGARRLRQYPHELSGGMLQRVMIAAALLTEPRLLLADEPTTALDVTTQAEVMAILDDLRHEFGLAMLFITHDLELAAAICDRTAVMYAGQIVEIRASARLHDDPLHPYTAALAAARPDIAQTADRLRAIPGRPLSAFEAPPDECAFAPRCAARPGRVPRGAARDHRAGRRAVPVRPRARAARGAGGAGRCLTVPLRQSSR